MERSVVEPLANGLNALGLDQEALPPLLRYLELLAKWNGAYNLSAVRDPQEMVSRHLLDSLVILPWVRGPRLLDVGSGAGLPGIPLAIARPDLQVVLLDSNGKKSRFQRQAVLELGLSNVEVEGVRVEQYRPSAPFDEIVSRAFAELALFVRLTEPLLAPRGRWLAMKGRRDENELAEIAAERGKLHVHPLQVPGLIGERHLIEIQRAG
jgi:16S rRNA (guanine527-N7)-methyltransferase